MASQKLAAWFLSDVGKKFSFFAAGAASTGALLVTFLPHTILLEQYKDFVHLYKNGMSVRLPQILHERFEKALDLVKVEAIDKHLYKPFSAYGFDVLSAGSSYSRFGVIVGLPINFTYDSVDMVDKSKIKIREESIIWDSQDGENLLNSLVMSENAQLYAMAREIKFRQTPKPLLDTVFASSSCILAYALSNRLNTKFNFYAKPFAARCVLYVFVGIFVYGSYAMMKDVTQMYFEDKIDKNLKKSNKIFAEGGKEYYSKVLERNQALRNLLGKDGERLYSVLGNENYLFRNKHLPIVHRKAFFEESA